MKRVKIQVAELEFEEGGSTVWVHSPRGMTVLRIAVSGSIIVHRTQGISSHCDISVKGDIDLFVADADKPPTASSPTAD